MQEYRAFQESFGAALRRDASSPAGVAATATARAMAVHRNNSAKAAQDALADNYPVTRAVVGDEPFRGCAAAFVDAHPPNDPRLCVYGSEFALFVDSYPPFSTLPYLPDLVRLERQVVEALFAADAPALDIPDTPLQPSPEAAIALHPATRYAVCSWPCVSIWLAHQDEAADNALENIVWRREIALITRPYGHIRVMAIDSDALAVVQACEARLPLDERAIAESRGSMSLATTLRALAAAGAFRRT
jgi:hypothetical protein